MTVYFHFRGVACLFLVFVASAADAEDGISSDEARRLVDALDAKNDPAASGLTVSNGDLGWYGGIGTGPIYGEPITRLLASPPDDFNLRLVRGLAETERFAVCHLLLMDRLKGPARYLPDRDNRGLAVWLDDELKPSFTPGDIPSLRQSWRDHFKFLIEVQSWDEQLPFSNLDLALDDRGGLTAAGALRTFIGRPPSVVPRLKRALADEQRFAAAHFALICEHRLPVVYADDGSLYGLAFTASDSEPSFDASRREKLAAFWDTMTALLEKDRERFRTDAAAGRAKPLDEYDSVADGS